MECQIVGFKVGEESYALNVLTIVQIIQYDQKITSVPRVPDFIEGIINLRGDVVPLVDLRKRFGCELQEGNDKTRIIIIRLEGYTSLLGLIVDSVQQVIRVNSEDMLDSPDILEGDTEYIKQVIKIKDTLYMLLNVEKLLSTHEQIKLVKSSLASVEEELEQ